MESAPPDDTDKTAAQIRELRKTGEEQTRTIDTLTSFLEGIEGSLTHALRGLSRIEEREEQKAKLARDRHDEVCKRLDANTTTLRQYGELLHAGLRRIERLEDAVFPEDEGGGSNGGGRPAQSAAE